MQADRKPIDTLKEKRSHCHQDTDSSPEMFRTQEKLLLSLSAFQISREFESQCKDWWDSFCSMVWWKQKTLFWTIGDQRCKPTHAHGLFLIWILFWPWHRLLFSGDGWDLDIVWGIRGCPDIFSAKITWHLLLLWSWITTNRPYGAFRSKRLHPLFDSCSFGAIHTSLRSSLSLCRLSLCIYSNGLVRLAWGQLF